MPFPRIFSDIKGYKCYSPSIKKFYHSVDVTSLNTNLSYHSGKKFKAIQFWELLQDSQTSIAPPKPTHGSPITSPLEPSTCDHDNMQSSDSPKTSIQLSKNHKLQWLCMCLVHLKPKFKNLVSIEVNELGMQITPHRVRTLKSLNHVLLFLKLIKVRFLWSLWLLMILICPLLIERIYRHVITLFKKICC